MLSNPPISGQSRVAAERLARSRFGDRVRARLTGPRPAFVGVSVLWSGQVLGALAVSVLARAHWSGVLIVWGGSHVTALAPEIAADPRYGQLVDGFVAGYAEETFRRMLQGDPLDTPGVFAAGVGRAVRAVGDGAVRPRFTGTTHYGVPHLTLPVQTSRGCAFGRCAFWTYPYVEGKAKTLPLGPLESVVRYARRRDAEVAVKDAFVTARRLDAVADQVGGRVRFAACTRLSPRIPRDRLRRWVRGGLATLEVGVESLDPRTLDSVDKRQAPELVDALLEEAGGLDLHLVLNAMFGFPGQREADARAELHHYVHVLPQRYPCTRFSIELNLLEVERRAPMGRAPERFGVTLGRTWPWATVAAWNAPAWCRDWDLGRLVREAA